jgi:hypothetical protein
MARSRCSVACEQPDALKTDDRHELVIVTEGVSSTIYATSMAEALSQDVPRRA